MLRRRARRYVGEMFRAWTEARFSGCDEPEYLEHVSVCAHAGQRHEASLLSITMFWHHTHTA